MTHKIAIITTGYEHYDDDCSRIVESITDWTEVSGEDLKCLKAMESKLQYHVIEQPVDADAFVKKTVAEYMVYVKAEAKRQALAKEKRDKAALERKMNKGMKDKASKEQMLAKLSEELGVEIVKKI